MPTTRSATRIPLNLFAIPLGIAGLGGSWLAIAHDGRVPLAVADVLFAVSAVVWLVVLAAYARYVVAVPKRLVADLVDPVGGPFASLVAITPILLAAQGVYPHAAGAGRILVDIFVVLTVLLGGWFIGQWIYAPIELDAFHPGYFLPTVAGGLVASIGAAEVGEPGLAAFAFGIGAVSWLALGPVILNRLLFRPMLPAVLVPTLAIQVAPGAVGSLAWFAMHGARVDTVAAVLGGYGLLMALAQLRLLPVYLRLHFMPSTWAFTFSWAAFATAGLYWLQATRPAGYQVYEFVVIVLITALIGGIAFRTAIALWRGQLLPQPGKATSVPVPAPAPAAGRHPLIAGDLESGVRPPRGAGRHAATRRVAA